MPSQRLRSHAKLVLVGDHRSIRRIVVDQSTGAPTEVRTELVNPGGCTGTSCECQSYCSVIPLPGGDYLFNSAQATPGAGGNSIAIRRYFDQVSQQGQK